MRKSAWRVLVSTVLLSFLPSVETDADVRVLKDVSYLGDDREEKLDLYLPAVTNRDDKARRPAVVIIHGGGWHGGDKAAKREQNIGNALAEAGYVCASINYELASKSELLADRLKEVWPRNLHDCKTAIRFLRKYADKYNIDSDHIGAIGGSAGGHLAAMLAVTDADDGLDPEGLYTELSCRIQAYVPMYGVHDVLEQARKHGQAKSMTESERQLCRSASPVTYITSDDPLALILHGSADNLVPTTQSQILFDRLRKAKVAAELHVIEGAAHSFHLQPEQRDLRLLVIEFLDRHLKGDRP
jgi:acetyl esterase/lipase